MSLYKPKNSPYYQFDFELGGHRFSGTTKCTSRREAEAVERTERERAKRRVADLRNTSIRLDLDSVIDRFWIESGQHFSGAGDTWRDLGRLIDFFGATRLITEIRDDDIAKLVAWRRGHRIIRSKKTKLEDCPLVSNGTVNLTTALLRMLFNRAKRNWGVRFQYEPQWQNHMLPQPQERVRELVGDEGERLEAATREDLRPFFDFLTVSGLRKKEGYTLRWLEVNWSSGQIVKLGKKGNRVVVPITSTIRSILEPLQGHHPEFVFTFCAQSTQHGRIRGQRYPLHRSNVNGMWRRLRKRAGIKDFRIHDLRHDFATKLLRSTRNLKLVQKALNHRDITSTLRYAHVLDEEVADAMEEFAQERMAKRNQHAESRNNSQSANRKRA